MAERKNYYEELIRRLLSGDPLSDQEIRDLAFAYSQEPPAEKPDTSLEELAQGLQGSDNVNRAQHIQTFIDQGKWEDAQTIRTRAATGGKEELTAGGLAAGALGTIGIATAPTVAGAIGRAVGPTALSFAGSAASRVLGKGGILRSKWAKRILTGGVIGAGAGLGFSTMGGEAPAPNPSGANVDPNVQQGADEPRLVYIDPQTGQPITVTQSQLDSIDPSFSSPTASEAANAAAGLSPDLAGFAQSLGFTQADLAALGSNSAGILDATFLGETTLKQPVNFSVQQPRLPITSITRKGETRSLGELTDPVAQHQTGGIAGPPQTGISQHGADLNVPSIDPIYGSPLQAPDPYKQQAAAAVSDLNLNIPAGATVNPKIATLYNGQPLIAWAARAAQQYDVPLNVLYGLVQLESGWNPNAVGDNGNSFGLAQIYLPVWGESVSKNQALDPVFALNWTARSLRSAYDKYHRWDVAVANHNSPVAAQHLAKTGEFYDAKSKNYVGAIFKYANESGLANWQFDLGNLSATGTTGTGPDQPVFRAPDPATLRQFIRESYTDIFGRDPSQEELSAGVGKLTNLYKLAFDREVGSGGLVDPGAQYTEQLQSTGEAQFRRDQRTQRSMTDYAGQIAQLLQAGI